jgi:hypothetical protein
LTWDRGKEMDAKRAITAGGPLPSANRQFVVGTVAVRSDPAIMIAMAMFLAMPDER